MSNHSFEDRRLSIDLPKLRRICDRIDAGDYDEPEVVDRIADRMLPLVMGGQGRSVSELRDNASCMVIVYSFCSIILASLIIISYFLSGW